MLWGNIQVSLCPNIFCSENFVISAKIFVGVSRKLKDFYEFFSAYLSVVKMWLFSRDFWSFDCIKTLYMLRLKGVFSRKMTLLAAARKNLGHVDAFIQQTDDAHGSGTLKNLYFFNSTFFCLDLFVSLSKSTPLRLITAGLRFPVLPVQLVPQFLPKKRRLFGPMGGIFFKPIRNSIPIGFWWKTEFREHSPSMNGLSIRWFS